MCDGYNDPVSHKEMWGFLVFRPRLNKEQKDLTPVPSPGATGQAGQAGLTRFPGLF